MYNNEQPMLSVVRIDQGHYRVYEDTISPLVWEEKQSVRIPQMIDGITHQILADLFDSMLDAEVTCTCCNTPLTALESRLRGKGPICHTDSCLKLRWVQDRDWLLRDSSSGRTRDRQSLGLGSIPKSRTKEFPIAH